MGNLSARMEASLYRAPLLPHPLHASSIQEGLKQARQAGDDKKLGMVASRR